MYHSVKIPCVEGAKVNLRLEASALLSIEQLVMLAQHRHWTATLRVSATCAGPQSSIGNLIMAWDGDQAGRSSDLLMDFDASPSKLHALLGFKEDIERCQIEIPAPEIWEMVRHSTLGVLQFQVLACEVADVAAPQHILMRVRTEVVGFTVAGKCAGLSGVQMQRFLRRIA